jgi:tetrapyrrole methylase family protein/MazG family protein
MSEKLYSMQDLINITRRLIAKDGCPWDREQTHKSLTKYMLEESYEVIDAINNDDIPNLKEELGDVLFQVVLHSAIAEREEEFTLDEVVNGIAEKMVYRHPHLFNPSSTVQGWDELKKNEKGYKSDLDMIKSIPSALPSLVRAEKVLSKAYKYKLDTLDYTRSIEEIEGALSELKEATTCQNKDTATQIGNILLNLSKISLFLQINAEFSLTNAVKTYINNLED